MEEGRVVLKGAGFEWVGSCRARVLVRVERGKHGGIRGMRWELVCEKWDAG